MDQDESLDLLELDDGNEVDTLPEATPFSAPRPKSPWRLLVLGITIIILATWIIIVKIGGDSETAVNVDLTNPVTSVEIPSAPETQAPVQDLNVPAKPVEVAPAPVAEAPKPAPVEKPVEVKPVETDGTPIRVVEDRKEVTFNPDKAVEKPVQPVAKPKAEPKKITAPAPRATTKAKSTNGNIYVQFGSYSTRALAQAAEQKIRKSHSGLFNGKQFVILAAEVKGQTTYRLRIAFNSANDANGFCRNAKSDGLDCYVTK